MTEKLGRVGGAWSSVRDEPPLLPSARRRSLARRRAAYKQRGLGNAMRTLRTTCFSVNAPVAAVNPK
jgi:hypothetical protein